jgi:hypothetical protein
MINRGSVERMLGGSAGLRRGHHADWAARDGRGGAGCRGRDGAGGRGGERGDSRRAAGLPGAWPVSATKFKAFMWNGSSTGANLTAYAICASKPAGYVLRSNSATLPSRSASIGARQRPSGTSVLGGGVQLASPQAADEINASYPDPSFPQWPVSAYNGTAASQTETDYAICGRDEPEMTCAHVRSGRHRAVEVAVQLDHVGVALADIDRDDRVGEATRPSARAVVPRDRPSGAGLPGG